MHTNLFSRTLLLLASLGIAFTQAQAQTAPADTAAGAPSAAATSFRPATLFKLGLTFTNRTLVGGVYGLPIPLHLGAERRFTARWALAGNLSALGLGLHVASLGTELGLRRYYGINALSKTSSYGGNYLSINTRVSSSLYQGGLAGLDAQWGIQRRLGGHGLVDAFVGVGSETTLSFSRQEQRSRAVSPTLEFGARLSLVR